MRFAEIFNIRNRQKCKSAVAALNIKHDFIEFWMYYVNSVFRAGRFSGFTFIKIHTAGFNGGF